MALEAITEIDLDTDQPTITPVHAKQYDTARTVQCNLYSHGVKWYVPDSDYVAVVSYKRADRIGGFYDETEDGRQAVTVDSQDRSLLYAILDRNMLTNPGEVTAEIVFYYGTTGLRLSTFQFTVMVEQASITELDLANNPYFKVLSQQITDVLHIDEDFAAASASATAVPPKQSQPWLPGDPTVEITGGPGDEENPNQPYHFAFGVPTGPIGPAAVPGITTYKYAVSTSGTVCPAASDFSESTAPERGKYYWTQNTTTWNTGESGEGTSVTYTVSHIGENGTGAVHSINGKVSDVVLSAEDILMADGTTTIQQAIQNGSSARPLTDYNKILLLGDSYNYDYGDQDVKGYGWGYHLCQNVGLGTPVSGTVVSGGTTYNIKKITSNNVDKVILVAQNNGGFAKTPDSENASFNGKKYHEVIDLLYNGGITDFDLIIAQSGWNDSSDTFNISTQTIDESIALFMCKIKGGTYNGTTYTAKYPDAKVYIIPTNNRMPSSNAKRNRLKQIANSAFDHGAISTRYSYLWCAYGQTIDGDPYVAGDNDLPHMKDAGYNNLSKLINRFVATEWDGALPNTFESHAVASGSSVSGEILFEQGLKIQFGKVKVDSSGGATVSFTYAFTKIPFVMTMISGTSKLSVFDARAGNISATGCDIQAMRISDGGNLESGANLTVNWFAIGV